jgi:hypothetical protein
MILDFLFIGQAADTLERRLEESSMSLRRRPSS